MPPRPPDPTAAHWTRFRGSKEMAYCSLVVIAFQPRSRDIGGGLFQSCVMNIRFGTPSQKAPSAGVIREPPR